MAEGSSIAAALRSKRFDSTFVELYSEGSLRRQIPGSLAVKFSQSQTARNPEVKFGRKSAKRIFGARSPRVIVRRLGGPVSVAVSVIDDIGFDALSAMRLGYDLRPYKVRLRWFHASLKRFPFWISDPMRQILGQWFKTFRWTQSVIKFALKESDEWYATTGDNLET